MIINERISLASLGNSSFLNTKVFFLFARAHSIGKPSDWETLISLLVLIKEYIENVVNFLFVFN